MIINGIIDGISGGAERVHVVGKAFQILTADRCYPIGNITVVIAADIGKQVQVRIGGRIGCHNGFVNRGKYIGLRRFISQIDAADAGQILVAVDNSCNLAFGR